MLLVGEENSMNFEYYIYRLISKYHGKSKEEIFELCRDNIYDVINMLKNDGYVYIEDNKLYSTEWTEFLTDEELEDFKIYCIDEE
jgi:hypothetical protein